MPIFERHTYSLQGIFANHSGTAVDNFTPDIYLVGDQYRLTTCKGFHNSNPKIFLVAWEHKGFASVKSTPLCFAGKHACKKHSCFKNWRFVHSLQKLLIV